MSNLGDSVTNSIKSRVEDWVEGVLAVGSYVTVEWTVDITKRAVSPPIGTIKLGKQTYEDMNYGKETPETGTWMNVPVTVMLSDIMDEDLHPDEHPKEFRAMDVADDLIDYLETRRNNETEKILFNIHKVYDIRAEPFRGRRTLRNRKLATYVVEFILLVKWED